MTVRVHGASSGPPSHCRRSWRRGLGAAFFVAAAVAALAVPLDLFASHGVRATWQTRVEDRTVTVAQTLEHRVRFPNRHRALSRYIQNWPFDAHEPTVGLPRLDARLEGWLDVPPGPARVLRARSPNATTLRVNGGSVSRQPPLPPGRHYVVVRWQGRFDPRAELTLLWGPDEEGLSPIPRDAFTPPQGSWTSTRRFVWAGAAILAILLGLLALRAALPADPRIRRRRGVVFGASILLLAALGLRLWDYGVMPEFQENPDELFAIWNGWQLLEDGGTRGWSMWPHLYGSLVEVGELQYFRKEPFYVIEPYFEHPPLLHVLAGAAAHLGGAADWVHVRLQDARLVPIGLGCVTVLLVLLLGRRLWPGSRAPWLAATLYAVMPLTVLGDRVVKEEALVVPLALASLLSFLRWRDEGERRAPLLVAAVLAGLCPIAKVPGIVFLLSLAMLVAARGRVRAALLALGAGLAVSSLLLVYAAAIDWDVFWATLRLQSGRPTHWNLFPRWFADPSINHNLVGQGWLLFLWLAFLWTVARVGPRVASVLGVPVVVYAVSMGLASGNWTFGWYFLPFYPFLCLGAGAYLERLWDRPGLLPGFLFIGLLVMYSLNFTLDVDWARQRESWPSIRHMLTVFLAVTMAPYALWHLFPSSLNRGIARTITALGLATFIAVSTLFVGRYDAIYEDYRNFDTVRHFGR